MALHGIKCKRKFRTFWMIHDCSCFDDGVGGPTSVPFSFAVYPGLDSGRDRVYRDLGSWLRKRKIPKKGKPENSEYNQTPLIFILLKSDAQREFHHVLLDI
jgi:hypothetical protein